MSIVQFYALQHFITTAVSFVWLLCYLWYYIPPCIFVTILPLLLNTSSAKHIYIYRERDIYDHNTFLLITVILGYRDI